MEFCDASLFLWFSLIPASGIHARTLVLSEDKSGFQGLVSSSILSNAVHLVGQ